MLFIFPYSPDSPSQVSQGTYTLKTDKGGTLQGGAGRMTYEPPFTPESRKGEETLRDRVERARRAREDAAARVADRYAKIKPDRRKWRVRDKLEVPADPSHVR